MFKFGALFGPYKQHPTTYGIDSGRVTFSHTPFVTIVTRCLHFVARHGSVIKLLGGYLATEAM